MPRGDVDVFHFTVNGKLSDALGIEVFSGEVVDEFGVFGYGYEFSQLPPIRVARVGSRVHSVRIDRNAPRGTTGSAAARGLSA